MESKSLQNLIKQKSQEKGRPLKIICDWDEVLQPVNPKVWWLIANEKGWHESENPPFDQKWFQEFWEKSPKEYDEAGGQSIETAFAFNKHLKDKNRQDRRKMTEKFFFKYLKVDDYYEKSPFLSIAEELLQCLKENLISELVLVSASNGGPGGRKGTKFKNTFALFPNTSFSVQKPGRFKERGEYRWEWIRNNHPDFDIFIDDDPFIINDAQKNFTAEKIYVLPNYKCNNHVQGKNVYHVKQELSALTDEDFTQAAAEYKAKQANKTRTNKPTEPASQEQANNQSSSTKPINYALWISLGLGGMVVIVLIYYLLFKKRKSGN